MPEPTAAAPHLHHITVSRTARYATLGAPGPAIREVWIACHGYSELASTFLEYLSVLDDGTRWLIAPEALSRFYLESADGRRNRLGPIGASWMTREDRESEINDQILYLTQLHHHLFTQIERAQVTLTVLGFSQGGATTSRWLARSTIHVDRHICWASGLPDDVVAAGPSVFRGIPLTFVVGNRDKFLPAERIAEHEQTMKNAGFQYQKLTFSGGHRLDNDLLRQISGQELIPHSVI